VSTTVAGALQSGVQSVHRTLDMLEALAARGGNLPIAEIAGLTGLAAPTAHRLARTLVDRGYLRQLPDRSYALGYRLVPLGTAANVLVGSNADVVLRELVTETGETANLAILSGYQAEYVAQAPSRYTMRTFTEIGRRVDLHATGVGKALLSRLSDAEVREVIARHGLARHTPHTISTELSLLTELGRIREQGFATDEQEQEIGVRCVAVSLDADALAGIAVSISGPITRMTDELVASAASLLQTAADRLTAGLTQPATPAG
jgi:IclR family acetate operon transcriptional repressor